MPKRHRQPEPIDIAVLPHNFEASEHEKHSAQLGSINLTSKEEQQKMMELTTASQQNMLQTKHTNLETIKRKLKAKQFTTSTPLHQRNTGMEGSVKCEEKRRTGKALNHDNVTNNSESDSDDTSDSRSNLEDSTDLPSTSEILVEQRRHIARLAKAVNEEVSDMMNDNVDTKISDHSLEASENSEINDYDEHYVGDDGNTYHDEDEESESISFANTINTNNKNSNSKNEKQRYSDGDSDDVSDMIIERNDDDDSSNNNLSYEFEEDDNSSNNDEYEYVDKEESDESSDEGREDSMIHVDFGVFDLETKHIEAIIHLIDQFCPDKMNEVDRDDFGAALVASPYSCIVQVSPPYDDNNEEEMNKYNEIDNASSSADDNVKYGNDDYNKKEEQKKSKSYKEEEEQEQEQVDEEEETEVYGLSSILDLPHGVVRYPAALQSLYDLLKNTVWRTVAEGISPVDLLLSTEECANTSAKHDEGSKHNKTKKVKGNDRRQQYLSSHTLTSAAKCVLLINEYIRNAPLELTVQILEDMIRRFTEHSERQATQKTISDVTNEEVNNVTEEVYATFPCMYAVLAKIQRTPENADQHSNKQHGKEEDSNNSQEVSNNNKFSANKCNSAKEHKHGKTSKGHNTNFDMERYTFWREEDSILYSFRDKRLATFVYRCRPQYDQQPEQEIPLSVLFVLQHGALLQAIEEMKRQQHAKAEIVRFDREYEEYEQRQHSIINIEGSTH